MLTKAYVLPFVLYLLGTNLASLWPSLYPLGYSLVVFLTIGATGWLLWGRGIVIPHGKVLAAVVVGIVGGVLWIGLSELRLEAQIARHLPEWLRPQPRVGFSLADYFERPLAYWSFLVVRLAGLVGLVPLAEELFWRGFLARWLRSPDWQSVSLGTFSARSFFVVVLLFALAHPEWLAAAVYCALINGLLMWKRDLWSCIVAHAVSNLVLAVYVLSTKTWWLW